MKRKFSLLCALLCIFLSFFLSFTNAQLFQPRCNNNDMCESFEIEETCPTDCSNGQRNDFQENTGQSFPERKISNRTYISKSQGKDFIPFLLTLTIILVITILFLWIYTNKGILRKKKNIPSKQQKNLFSQKADIRERSIPTQEDRLPKRPQRGWGI